MQAQCTMRIAILVYPSALQKTPNVEGIFISVCGIYLTPIYYTHVKMLT